MRIRGTVLVVVMVAVLLGACGDDSDQDAGSGATTTSPAEEVDLSKAKFDDRSAEAKPEVDAVDNLFKPPYIIVKAGTTVTFRNDGTPVSKDYAPPFAFQGKLHLVTIDVPPAKPTAHDQRARAKAELAQQ